MRIQQDSKELAEQKVEDIYKKLLPFIAVMLVLATSLFFSKSGFLKIFLVILTNILNVFVFVYTVKKEIQTAEWNPFKVIFFVIWILMSVMIILWFVIKILQ